MHAFEPVGIGYNLPSCGIEDDQLVGIHMRNVKPATLCIEALIVKAELRPRASGCQRASSESRARLGGLAGNSIQAPQRMMQSDN